MSFDAPGVFHRPDPGDELQSISGCEKTGGVVFWPLGRHKGSIEVCYMGLLGGPLPIHGIWAKARQLLSRKPCFVVFLFVSLIDQIFLDSLKALEEE